MRRKRICVVKNCFFLLLLPFHLGFDFGRKGRRPRRVRVFVCVWRRRREPGPRKKRRMHLNIQIDVVMYFDSISYLKLIALVEKGFMAPLICKATVAGHQQRRSLQRNWRHCWRVSHVHGYYTAWVHVWLFWRGQKLIGDNIVPRNASPGTRKRSCILRTAVGVPGRNWFCLLRRGQSANKKKTSKKKSGGRRKNLWWNRVLRDLTWPADDVS